MGDTGYRTIQLTEDAYRQLERRKQSGESFSDTIERLVSVHSLLDLAGLISDAEAEELREAIRAQEERSRERLDRLTPQLDS